MTGWASSADGGATEQVKVSVRLPPSARAASQGRRAVRPLRGVAPLEVMERIELLVSELVTNAVVHGELPGNGWIDLRLRATPGLVRVEVRDPGVPFEPHPHPPPGTDSKWGLYLVSRLSDRWGVRAGDGKSVWFEVSW